MPDITIIGLCETATSRQPRYRNHAKNRHATFIQHEWPLWPIPVRRQLGVLRSNHLLQIVFLISSLEPDRSAIHPRNECQFGYSLTKIRAGRSLRRSNLSSKMEISSLAVTTISSTYLCSISDATRFNAASTADMGLCPRTHKR